jgi:ABC-type cobalamin/Fe3+-siderophores transport system ATPase subunit
LKNGDCFELIDGENLEFKGQFIKEIIESSKTDKVVVVCVIGPQSSGKSTLMNSALGA